MAVIECASLNLAKLLEDILDKNGRLTVDGSGCLGRGKVSNIAVAKDVGKAIVLQSVDVHIKPASFMGKWRASDECRSCLRRHKVEQVEVLSHSLVVGHVLEGGDTVVLINSDKLVVQELSDVLACALLSQSFAEIVIWRENNRRSTIVAHVSGISDSISAEGSFAEVQNLLRRATTLDGELRAREHSIAAAEVFSKD